MSFINKFKNMSPMKYYEADSSLPKAQEMIENKDSKFFAMRKHDGEWCRAIIGENGTVLLQSRIISKVTHTYGDKTLLVPHIVEELARHWPPNTVLLGELAFDDWTSTSTDVGSILRCKPGKAIARQTKKKLHFFIFDVLAYNGKDFVAAEYPFIERYKCYPEFNKNQLYYHHVLNDSGDHSNFTEFADFVWSKGGEGIMIVREDMLYQPGKRTSWHTLKLKKKLGEITTTVLSTLEPTREYEGSEIDSWKYFTIDDNNNKTAVTKPYYYNWKNGVVVDYNGVQVKVTSGLTDLDREYLAKEETQKLISEGKLKAVITGMSTTPDGSIRHPVLVRLV